MVYHTTGVKSIVSQIIPTCFGLAGKLRGMKDVLPNIAIALRRAREAVGLSQYELAEASGVARPTIAGIELGHHKTVKLDTLQQLAEALRIPVAELLEAKKSSPRPYVEKFLKSSWANALELQAGEIDWLRNLPEIWWLGGEPTNETFFHLIEALRKRTGTQAQNSDT